MASKYTRIGLIAALTALLLIASVGPAAAQSSRSTEYHVRDLPSLGGLLSAGISVNDRGWITGTSDLSGDTVTRAALWREGRVVDLYDCVGVVWENRRLSGGESFQTSLDACPGTPECRT
jgi:hypothetical protein